MKTRILLLCLALSFLYATAVHAQTTGPEVAVSLLNQNPDPARAGDVVEMRFKVENYGGTDIKDLNLELLMQYPLSGLSGQEYVRSIKTLSAYQQGDNAVIVKYEARIDRDAADGTNYVKLKVGRASDPGNYVTHTFEIDVSSKEFAQIIYIDKAKIDPGKETEMKFTITNVGNSPLKNLVFSWSEENGAILPVYSDDTKYVKYLDVDESVDLTYTVVADVNAEQGLYQLELSLGFDDESGTTKEISTRAGVFIGGETDFDVTFSESSEGQTSLSVANTGNNPALSVTVRIPEQENFEVSGSTSSIIGNLDKGDYTIVSFQVSRAFSPSARPDNLNWSRQPSGGQANASEDNELEVLIEYTDTTGVRHSVEKAVPVQLSSADASGTATTSRFQRTNVWTSVTPYIILLALVIAGFFGYRKREILRGYLGKIKKKNRG